MHVPSHDTDRAARLMRWRLLFYLLLFAAAALLAAGERFRPTPAPTNSAHPVVDTD